MLEFLAPLTPQFTLIIPKSLSALIGWVIGFLVIIGLAISLRDRVFKLNRTKLLWFAGLSVLILILTPFVGVLPKLSSTVAFGEVPFQHLMFFAAIPWMVGAGILGFTPTILLAGISGLFLAYLDTHNIFTPILTVGAAIIFCWSLQQRYRTKFFKWLRFPIVAAFFSILAITVPVFIVLLLNIPGSISARIGAALMRFPAVMFSLGGMMVIGGVISVIIKALAPKSWVKTTPLKPAPGEVNFKFRLMSYTVPIFMMVLVGVFIGSWTLGQKFARKQAIKRLINTTEIAVEGFNAFLKTGDQILDALALYPQIKTGSVEEISSILEQIYDSSDYFDELGLIDRENQLFIGVPAGENFEIIDNIDPYSEIAFDNLQNTAHRFTQGLGDENNDEIIFIRDLSEPVGDPSRFLFGKTQFNKNHFAQPLMTSITALVDQKGKFYILDKDGKVLYQNNANDNLSQLSSFNFNTPTFFQSASDDGNILFNYFHPVKDTDWGIAASFPSLIVQELAWEITRTNLTITTCVMLIVFIGAWLVFKPVIKELDALYLAINTVVVGESDLNQMAKQMPGKKSHLQNAFQNMINLQKKRLDQQEQLLSVSTEVARMTDLSESLMMILSSALLEGVLAVRILTANSKSGIDTLIPGDQFGTGPLADLLEPWDWALEDLVLKGGQQFVTHDEIRRHLPFIEANLDEIQSIIALPLQWNSANLGVIWFATAGDHHFDDTVLEYFKQIAQIASLAIFNAKTNQDYRLSTAIMKTFFDLLPDAVLIADQNDRVLLHNATARQLFITQDENIEGKALSDLFSQTDIEKINTALCQSKKTKELDLDNGKAYDLKSSPIQMGGHQIAKMFIFKDLTTQKKADAVKSEFVTMVSHELRSPLTMILGYTKILRLTGNLTEQQDNYIGNIVDNVEEMKELVQKLLDIGRLESGYPLERAQVSAEHIINKAIEYLEAKAKQKQIAINIDHPDNPVVLIGDQTFLTQAVKNLLDNAIKFSKMGGAVTIGVREKSDRVLFEIQDQGIGIAPLDQRNLFTKFSKSSTNADVFNEGSGLGLSIVKSIAEHHGGKVWMESKLGKGSTFYFEIPRKYTP